MQSILLILFLPIMALNFFGGIIGGIWLIILGEWGAVGMALGAAIFGAFFCSFLLMPGLLFSGPGLMLFEKKGLLRLISYPLLLLGFLWTYVVMSVWALGLFLNFLNRSDSSSLIPMMMVAFSAATGPWSYMAQQEARGGNEYSSLTAMFLSVACAIAFFLLAFTEMKFTGVFVIFISIMGIVFFIQLVIAIKTHLVESKKYFS
jgi:hypothetical protein